jgi:hypothetical protein
MIDSSAVPEVSEHEIVARFILQEGHVRADQSVKPNAFIPPENLRLSVTRHLSATEVELWAVANGVAIARAKTLHGRADVGVSVCIGQNLSVHAAPVPGNPNHADICDWPADKPAKKVIAQELAAKARFKAVPT